MVCHRLVSCSLDGIRFESRNHRFHMNTYGWPKWSPTSACQSGDQFVDKPYENTSSPRAQGARIQPARAGFGRFRTRPGIQIQNSELPMNC